MSLKTEIPYEIIHSTLGTITIEFLKLSLVNMRFLKLYFFILIIVSCKGLTIEECKEDETFYSGSLQSNSELVNKIWEQFTLAIDSNNTDKLLEISLPQIECVNCSDSLQTDIGVFPSKLVVEKELKKLRYFDNLQQIPYNYNFNVDSSLLSIVIETEFECSRNYVTYYYFVPQKGKWLFKGMAQ